MNSILRIQKKFNGFFDSLSYLEDFVIGNDNKSLVDSNLGQVFLTGMPRSGTTIITHILSNFEDVGTYNYSDLPFFKLPYFWSKFSKFYYLNNKTINRPHGDGLRINIYSPDAFEELIWSENLEDYNSGGFFQYLDSNYKNLRLEEELIRNINKILIVRKKNIYLSKGNYNVFRINFIKNVFPNAFFIICIRNPVDVVNSSVKTHKKFIEINNQTKDFAEETSELCHFEFGENRVNITDDRPFADDYDYYLNQWNIIHDLIRLNYLNKNNVYLFDFDKFLLEPRNSIMKLSEKIKLRYTESIDDYIKENVNSKDMNLKGLSRIENQTINSLYKELLPYCIN